MFHTDIPALFWNFSHVPAAAGAARSRPFSSFHGHQIPEFMPDTPFLPVLLLQFPDNLLHVNIYRQALTPYI